MRLAAAFLGLVLTLEGSAFKAQAVDESKPYGRACVTGVDPKENKEALLGGGIPARSGHLLTIHLEANGAGEALVVALTRKENRLAHGWWPLIVPLAEWKEMTVPAASAAWKWTDATDSFDVFVVFLDRNSPAVEMARKLVEPLRKSAGDDKALATQVRSLREQLQKWQAHQGALARQPEISPVAIAGTVRNVGEFPWRGFAYKANFDAARPAVLVFRHAVSN